MKSTKNLRIDEIRATAVSGATVTECVQEAILIAATEWINVSFEHNGSMYHVDIADLNRCVKDGKKP